MFDHLGGGIVSAESGERSRTTLRVNQATVFVLLAGTFGATIFTIVQAAADPPSVKDWALFGSFFAATGLGTTVGFHRLVTHRSFETHPLVKAVLVIFGTWAIQGAAVTWAAIHEKHHVYSDTEQDPHSPVTKSFFHGHMGWMFGTVRGEPEQYVKAQLQDPVVMFVSRTAFWWAVLGLVLPGIIGGWSGFLWGSMVRVFVVHHATWSVNSVCHRVGSRPFKTGKDRSTNNWLVALWALGEGWHNNHHAFPRSAFHGLGWWQVDISAYVIRLMGWLRLARSIYRVPKKTISLRLAEAE